MNRSSRSYLVGAGILAAGWSLALAVYRKAAPALQDDDAYDMEHSRRYLREVERIGGKASIFANDLREWVSSLCRGTSLAYTIAVLTVAVALAYVLAAERRATGGGRG